MNKNDINKIYNNMKYDVTQNMNLFNIMNKIVWDRYDQYEYFDDITRELGSLDIFEKMKLDVVMKNILDVYPDITFEYTCVGVLDIVSPDIDDDFCILIWSDHIEIYDNDHELYYDKDDFGPNNITNIVLEVINDLKEENNNG